MRSPNKPTTGSLSKLPMILSLLTTLGCEIPSQATNIVESGENVSDNEEARNPEQEGKIEEAIGEIDDLLNDLNQGTIEKNTVTELVIAQIEIIGGILQGADKASQEVTPARIFDSGLNKIMEVASLREKVSNLMTGQTTEAE